MGRRRARRRIERQRAKRPQRQRMSVPSRIAVAAVGALMVVSGIVLLAAGSSNERIPRLAGILILVGVVVFVAALLGAL